MRFIHDLSKNYLVKEIDDVSFVALDSDAKCVTLSELMDNERNIELSGFTILLKYMGKVVVRGNIYGIKNKSHVYSVYAKLCEDIGVNGYIHASKYRTVHNNIIWELE